MDFELFGQGITIQQIKTSEPRNRPLFSIQNLDLLRSSFLDSNSTFSDLKSQLENFYKEKSEGKVTKWKEVLFNSLHSLLTEVVYTTDRKLQISLLSSIQKWFNSKTNPAKPTHLYHRQVPSDPQPRSKVFELSMRSTAQESFNNIKTSTPQPRAPQNIQKRTYQAFVNPVQPPDPEFEAKMEKYFSGLKDRQAKSLQASNLKAEKLQEWSDFKVKRLENLNLRREIGSVSFSVERDAEKPNQSLYDFSVQTMTENFSENEERYSMFNRTGMLRKMRQGIIDIEEVPRKWKGLKNPEPFNSPGTGPGTGRAMMNELFDIKNKLAKRAIKSNMKELELSVLDAQVKLPSVQSDLPTGGESLLVNPFIEAKSSKKSKKKKSKKKN